MHKTLLIIFIALLTPLSYTFADDAKIKRFKNSFDKNSDGVVTLEEYTTTRSKWGKAEDESKKFFNYHDKDKNGELTLEEFLSSK